MLEIKWFVERQDTEVDAAFQGSRKRELKNVNLEFVFLTTKPNTYVLFDDRAKHTSAATQQPLQPFHVSS